MSKDDVLFNPPHYVYSGPRGSSFLNPCLSTNAPLIIDNTPKYGYTEAKLRILYCCRDLEISETNQIKYPDVQKIYEKRFGTPLNREEMKELFGISKGTNILKQEFYKYFVVTEASENEDQCIKLRMKGDIDEVIDELANLYAGIEKLPRMDPVEVEETLRPGAAREKALASKDQYIPPRDAPRIPTFNNDFDIPASYNRGQTQRHYPEASTPVSQSTESRPNRTSSNGSRSGSGRDNDDLEAWKREYNNKLKARNVRWEKLRRWREMKRTEYINAKSSWTIAEYQEKFAELKRYYNAKAEELKQFDNQVDDLYFENVTRLEGKK